MPTVRTTSRPAAPAGNCRETAPENHTESAVANRIIRHSSANKGAIFAIDDFARARGRHQQLLHRARFALFDHGGRRDQRPVQHQQYAESSGHDEPRVTSPGLKRNAGCSITVPRAPRGWCRRSAESAHACRPAPRVLIPVLNHAFGVALRDGGRVRVHGIEQDLHRRWRPRCRSLANSIGTTRPASSSPRAIASPSWSAEHRYWRGGSAALSHARDQVAAFRRMTRHRRCPASGEPPWHSSAKPNSSSWSDGRHDQRDRQTLVAADLIEFLSDQRAQPPPDDRSIHMLSCILRIFRHASRIEHRADYCRSQHVEPHGGPSAACQQRVAHDFDVISCPRRYRKSSESAPECSQPERSDRKAGTPAGSRPAPRPESTPPGWAPPRRSACRT